MFKLCKPFHFYWNFVWFLFSVWVWVVGFPWKYPPLILRGRDSPVWGKIWYVGRSQRRSRQRNRRFALSVVIRTRKKFKKKKRRFPVNKDLFRSINTSVLFVGLRLDNSIVPLTESVRKGRNVSRVVSKNSQEVKEPRLSVYCINTSGET